MCVCMYVSMCACLYVCMYVCPVFYIPNFLKSPKKALVTMYINKAARPLLAQAAPATIEDKVKF